MTPDSTETRRLREEVRQGDAGSLLRLQTLLSEHGLLE
jgi:hypothetical protein